MLQLSEVRRADVGQGHVLGPGPRAAVQRVEVRCVAGQRFEFQASGSLFLPERFDDLAAVWMGAPSQTTSTSTANVRALGRKTSPINVPICRTRCPVTVRQQSADDLVIRRHGGAGLRGQIGMRALRHEKPVGWLGHVVGEDVKARPSKVTNSEKVAPSVW